MSTTTDKLDDNDTTIGSIEGEKSDGIGSVIICIFFVIFVIIMVIFHCYLKKRRAAHIDKLANNNRYSFDWDQNDD